MALQGFVSYVTKVTATWLNKMDTLFVTVFGEAQTKETARTALYSDLTPAADKLPYFATDSTTLLTSLSTFGRSLIDDAAASNARTTLGVVIGTDVQAYDASLTSLATLATAADKIAYTTAADTWAETAITTFGRSLIDDAAASNARTTLGLGTSAVIDTGTSGTKVALTDGANTWSADQTLQSTDAGATVGPTLILDRNSASPAAADVLGAIPFKGRDSGAGTDTYAQIQAEIVDATATSEDGKLAFQTAVAGTLATRGYAQNGLVWGSATGGDQGAGTINAVGIYDDGVLLTPAAAATQSQIQAESSNVVFATPSNLKYRLGSLDPETKHEFYEDFNSERASGSFSEGWSIIAGGLTGIAGRGGVARFSDSGVNMSVQLANSATTLPWITSKNPVMKVRMANYGSTGGTRRIALTDGSPEGGTIHTVQLRWTPGTNLILACRAGGSESTLDSGVAMETGGTFHTAKVVVTGTTSVELFVDGVSKGTVTTNIPTNAMLMWLLLSGSAAANGIDVDYIQVVSDR